MGDEIPPVPTDRTPTSSQDFLASLDDASTRCLDEVFSHPIHSFRHSGQLGDNFLRAVGPLPTCNVLPVDGPVTLQLDANLAGRSGHLASTNPYGRVSLDVRPAPGLNGNQLGDYGYNFLAATTSGNTTLHAWNNRLSGIPSIDFASRFNSPLGESTATYRNIPGVHLATFNSRNDLYTTSARHDFLAGRSTGSVLSTPENPWQFGFNIDAQRNPTGHLDTRYQFTAQTPDRATSLSLRSLEHRGGPGVDFRTNLAGFGLGDTSINYFRDESVNRAGLTAGFTDFGVGASHDFRTNNFNLNLTSTPHSPLRFGIGAGFGRTTTVQFMIGYGNPGGLLDY